MRKAILLDVKLWVEGDDEPTHDFAASAEAAVRAILAKGADARPDVTVKVRSVKERGA